MTLDLLFPHFDELIRTPEDVQRLNEAILQLAVQGKLVPQDPEDEPASGLLKRVEATRRQLGKAGRVDKARDISEIEQHEYPFRLPTGWSVTRLGALVSKLGAGSTPLGGKSVYEDDGVKFIRSQNVWNDGLRVDDVAFIPESIHQRMSGTEVLPKDVLLNITGASIGRSAIVPDDFDVGNVSQHVAIVRLLEPDLRRFVHLYVISPYFQRMIMDVEVGISREGLSMSRLQHFVLPVPPLAEQHRIVAKVDALFAQTRALEASLRQAQADIVTIHRAARHRLHTAQDDGQFQAAWRTLREHFDVLHDDPRNVAELRQAILDLAVRGKLVVQDPEDEPAEELLRTIKAKKKELVTKGKLKKSGALPDNRPKLSDNLPNGWSWALVDDLCYVGTGATPHRGELRYYEDGEIPWITSAATGQRFITEASEYISEQALVETNCQVYPKHTLIVGLYGQGKTRGQVSELLIEAATNQACAALVFDGFSDSVRPYVKLFFQRNYQELRELAEGGAQPNLNVGKVRTAALPLPPLAEQHHIVAKVDQLMRLCDALEAGLLHAQAGRQRLVEAVLHGVTAS